MCSVRHVTADMFLAIKNPFESNPAGGWGFSLQASGSHYKNHNRPETPEFSAAKTAGENPDLVQLFEKRMQQKFDARWFQTNTVYPRQNVENV